MAHQHHSEDFKEILEGLPKRYYGENYYGHVLEIYKVFLGTAEKTSDRRNKANSFFLSLNTALAGLIGYLTGLEEFTTSDPWISIIGLLGISISYLWYRIILSYRGLNSGKFKVLHEMENFLPLRPLDAEWEAIGRGKNPLKYRPFTKVEKNVAKIFMLLHFVAFLRGLPWAKLSSLIFYGP